MSGKLNIKLKPLPENPINENISAMDTKPIEPESSTESNEGKVFQEMEPQPNLYDEEPIVHTFPVDEPGHLDLLKSALILIIDKAEAIDINVDKPKLLAKLKGALKILNQN